MFQWIDQNCLLNILRHTRSYIETSYMRNDVIVSHLKYRTNHRKLTDSFVKQKLHTLAPAQRYKTKVKNRTNMGRTNVERTNVKRTTSDRTSRSEIGCYLTTKTWNSWWDWNMRLNFPGQTDSGKRVTNSATPTA